VNLKRVSPVSNENDRSEKPGFYVQGEEELSAPTPQSYKRGWGKSVPVEDAIKDTVAEVARLYPGQQVIGEPEIIETDEHKEANEYLVKVLVL
jgi:hypothetical protein